MRRFVHVLAFLLTSIPSFLFASHFMGGEITWECLTNGNYRFIMKVYRECNGITYSNPVSLTVSGCPGLTSISLSLYPNATLGKKDISPVCNLNNPGNPLYQHIVCSPQPSVPNTGAIEEWVFTSDAAYPNGVTINGVPPATGWTFAFTNCCRNPCSNIQGSSSLNWYLRAIMYPYMGANTFPCWDNSPVFAERPACVVGTNFPQQYNPNAYDPEGDSLSFGWAQALTGLSAPITTYGAGYTYNSPLPGLLQNAGNIPATIDSTTGEISFKSLTQGAFVTASRTTAFKRGTRIAEIFREMQIVLLPSSNLPPVVTPPFPLNIVNPWVDTVYAGDLVTFPMVAVDSGLQNNGVSPQNVVVTASGALFGTGFLSTTAGCLEPPCATLNPPPPMINLTTVTTNFSWQTSCAHESFGTGNDDFMVDYYFVFTFRDDYCPAPGLSERTVKIVVKDPPPVLAPAMGNLTVDPGNGDVTLNWSPPADPYNTFKKYLLFYKNNPGGTFVFLDSINSISQTSYTHVGANGNQQPLWYKIQVVSGCMGNKFSGYSNQAVNPLAQAISINPVLGESPNIKLIYDPSSGLLSLAFQNVNAKQLKLEVHDALGNEIYSTFCSAAKGENYLKFRLNQPKAGVYFYKVCLDNTCKNGKFLITR
jgi:hypothetical protein